MKRGIKLFLLYITFLIGLTGCSRNDKSEKFQSDYMELNASGTKVEEGIFFVESGISYYIDFDSKKAVPICNKPDCRHLSEYEDKNTNCNAAKGSFQIFPYQGKLCGMEYNENGTELFVSELDGSNRTSKGNFINEEGSYEYGVVVQNELFYFYSDIIGMTETDGVESVKMKWHFNVLDLNTMKQEEIMTEEADYMKMLGGTKEFQIFSVIQNQSVIHYKLDYKKRTMEEIPFQSDGYGYITMALDENSFYYVGGDAHLKENIFQYSFDSKETEVCVKKEEIADWAEDSKMAVIGVYDEKLIFGVHAGKNLRWFYKDMNQQKIYELLLPQKLPRGGAQINSIIGQTKDGLYFDYYITNQESGDEGDWTTWYGYISWEDLLSGKNDVKVVLNPRVSSGGNLVDKDGNVIGTESRAKYD